MSISSLVLGLSAALAVHPVHDPDQDRRPASILPSTTLAFAEFAGLSACSQAAKGSELLALVERLAAARLGASPATIVAREGLPHIDHDLAQFGLDSRALRELLNHPIALGAGRVVSFDNEFMPSLALVIDAGDSGPAVERTFQTFESRALSHEELQASDLSIDGVSVRVIRNTRRTGEITFARIDRFAVLTVGLGYMRDIIRTARSSGHSIVDHEVVQTGRRLAGDAPLLWGCVNVRPVTALLRLYAPYEADPILDALGLDSIDGLVFGTSFQHGTSADFIRVLGTIGTDGLLSAVGGARVDRALLASLPADALLVGGLALDALKLEATAHRLFDALPPVAQGELSHEFERAVARGLGRGAPMREIHELVRAIGPDAAMSVSMPGTGLGIPSGMVVIRLREGASVGDTIAKIVTDAGMQLRSQEVDGTTLRWTSIPGVPSGVSPAFAEANGRLYISSDVRLLRQALGANATSLDVKQGTAAGSTIEHSAGWMWLRAKDNVASLWESYGPMLENMVAANPDLPISADDLPTAEELHAALRDVTLGMGVDAQGIGFHVTSPIGLGTFVAALGSVFNEAASGAQPKRDN